MWCVCEIHFAVRRKQKEAAVAAHQQFHSKLGDHISGLNLYRAYIGLPKKQQPSWCQEHFVSARSLHKATAIYQQLHQQLTSLGLPTTSAGPEVELVLKALVAGLFTNAARRQLNGTVMSLASYNSLDYVVPYIQPSKSSCTRGARAVGSLALAAPDVHSRMCAVFLHLEYGFVHAYALVSDIHVPALRSPPFVCRHISNSHFWASCYVASIICVVCDKTILCRV